MKDWLIFDADNTLWNIEPLYDGARKNLIELLARHDVDSAKADSFQRARDAVLFQWYGYSQARFPQSFLDTVEHFLGSTHVEAMREALRIGRSVFESDPEPFENVAETISRLKDRYHVGILTAGDRDVQRNRLERFQHKQLFPWKDIEIVDKKTPQTMLDFLSRRGASPGNAWMIGDSLRSDILPAHMAGLKAIHLGHANWTPIELDHHTRPDGVFLADRFEDIQEILL